MSVPSMSGNRSTPSRGGRVLTDIALVCGQPAGVRGPLIGSLLNLSYGLGNLFVVLHNTIHELADRFQCPSLDSQDTGADTIAESPVSKPIWRFPRGTEWTMSQDGDIAKY
jgi:hypothetical protein